jgi:glyoxylase-like metal-dependent hydrolase (beta-lactamase superfamily II)
MRWAAGIGAALLSLASQSAAALELIRVAEGAYALVGDLGQRSPDNLGSNSTHGFVITPDGVVVIDPGATAKGARRIEQVIRTVSDRPIVAVINSGGQDHRWLGNGYFKAQGATIIAAAEAVADQRKRLDEQWAALKMLVGEAALESTTPTYADIELSAPKVLSFGGIRFVIVPSGGAHTPGDAMIWLPEAKIVFAGDIVYIDRLVAVAPVSHAGRWIEAFDRLAELLPDLIVPGHGRPTTLVEARKATRDYLDYLRRTARAAIDQGKSIEATLKADQSAFAHLDGSDQLAKRNLQQVYLEMEFE